MSENTSLLQRLMHLSSTFGTALEQMVEAAKAASGNSGEAKASVKRKTSFSARTLDGGDLADLAELANRLKAKPEAPVPMRRNLDTEVVEEAEHVIVLINEPSVQMSNLVVAIDGDMLELSAQQAETIFIGEVFLPCTVNPDTLLMLARAGVIELRWEKQLVKAKKPSKSKAKPVPGTAPSEC